MFLSVDLGIELVRVRVRVSCLFAKVKVRVRVRVRGIRDLVIFWPTSRGQSYRARYSTTYEGGKVTARAIARA